MVIHNKEALVGINDKKAMVDVNDKKTLVDVNDKETMVETYDNQTLVGFNNQSTMVVGNEQKTVVCKWVWFRFLELELMDPGQRKRVDRREQGLVAVQLSWASWNWTGKN